MLGSLFGAGLLAVGDVAPDFALPDAEGQTVRLADFRGRASVVLIFYPADFTPVCTTQLCGFRDALASLAGREDVAVLGINPGKAGSHQRFSAQHQLGFPLLVDAGLNVARAYKTVLLPGLLSNRSVYGIDSEGVIRYARMGNPPPAEVLAALDLS